MIDNSNQNCEWYVFYNDKHSTTPEMMRIASDCLGNALTVAKEWANRCKRQLIGVSPDSGVPLEDLEATGKGS